MEANMATLSVLRDCCTIQLPNGYNALVDAEVYRLANSLTWGVIHNRRRYPYAIHQIRRMGKLLTVKLHQFIASPPNGMLVDHINGDTLDNRARNLRLASHSENVRNSRRRNGSTSRFKGVSWHAKQGHWAARITKDRVTHALGYFEDEREAAEAYDRAAVEMHGEFAMTNQQMYPDEFAEAIVA
jgi:hypothetical protein